MCILYYHFDSWQSVELIEAVAESAGAAFEVEPDEDGIGVTVYAPDQIAVCRLHLELVGQPLWLRP